jgi:hypothetical protein
METKQISASNCQPRQTRIKKSGVREEKEGGGRGEYGLRFPAFCGSDLKDDFVIFDFTADDFCVEFEFETLFCEHSLK